MLPPLSLLPIDSDKLRIAVLGLGYVGLPLAQALGRHYPAVLGYDIDAAHVESLRIEAGSSLIVSSDETDLADYDCFIVTVPTGVGADGVPDLSHLESASRSLARHLRKGCIVIYESTVYPGVTEEFCVPILSCESTLAYNRDFYVGYSPERISTGDHQSRLAAVVKITAGSTPEIAEWVDALYRRIITAGTCRASSIRAAEAAKILENSQRDVNIALINELARNFAKNGLETQEIIRLAATKWNFVPYYPGLVGGYCIPAASMQMIHKMALDDVPSPLLRAARIVNESMADFMAATVVARLGTAEKVALDRSCVLVLGLSFKENQADHRDSRVFDLVGALTARGCRVDIFDPHVDKAQIRQHYDLTLLDALPDRPCYAAIVIAVGHDCFRRDGIAMLRSLLSPDGFIYDAKGIFPADSVDLAL